MIFRAQLVLAQIKEYSTCNDPNPEQAQNNPIKFLHQMDHPVPIAAKEISHATNYGCPDHRATEVENEKTQIRHLEGTGEDSGEHAQAGDETRDEYRPLAVFQVIFFSAIEVPREKTQPLAILLDESLSAVASQTITQGIANRGAGDSG